MAGRIQEAAGGSVRDKTIAILGVTFKPNTDDMREAASLVIFPLLQARGARIRAYDPQGRTKGRALLPNVEWCTGIAEAAKGADVLVVLTEWNEFRASDLKEVRKVMKGNVLVDLRNMYDPAVADAAGFIYCGIGRGALSRAANGFSHPPLEPGDYQSGSVAGNLADQIL